ncbi:MAG: tripartite tricarboxylate transporter permease [Streptomycetales bacterium]
MLDAAASALGSLLDPSVFLMLFVGVCAGLVFGLVPGLGGTGAVAILLPFVLFMDPGQGLALIIGAVATVHTSDTIAAVLLGVPGSASAAVTLLDGHEMAKQGQAARALSAAFLSSMAGGLLGALGLTFSIPVARPLVLTFGAPELFMLALLGISLTGLLSRGNVTKGLVAGAVGVLIGTIGAAPATAEYRYTFGTLFLADGLELVPVVLGVFGLAEIAGFVASRSSVASRVGLGTGWLDGVRDFLRHWRFVIRGSLVGIWAGVLPGIGATAGTWMAYGQAVATSKDKRKYGKGDPRGIVAPESANNSVEAGDLIPTLLFGIPGGVPAAMLLGALLVYGVETGPRMVTEHLDLIYLTVWSFALASIMGAGLCFLASKPLARLSFVPFQLLAPALVVVMFLSAFQSSGQLGDLAVMLVLGVFGWVLKQTGFPRAPLLVGFVLALPLERYYFQTTSLYATTDWITRPWVVAMAVLLIAPLLLAVVRRLRARNGARNGSRHEGPDQVEGGGGYAGTLWPVIVSAALAVTFLAALAVAQGYDATAALLPNLVGVLGAVLSTVVCIRELRGRRATAERPDWRPDARSSARAFGWMLLFLVLVSLAGTLLAAAAFVPLFLLVVARWRPVKIAVYTAVLLLVLAGLGATGAVDLPGGLLVPELVYAT